MNEKVIVNKQLLIFDSTFLKKHLLFFFGLPTSGKDTLIDLISHKNDAFRKLPLFTTRPLRVNENNYEYIHLNKDDFITLKDKMFYVNEKYHSFGYSWVDAFHEFENNNTVCIKCHSKGINELHKNYPFIPIIYVYCEIKEIIKRIKKYRPPKEHLIIIPRLEFMYNQNQSFFNYFLTSGAKIIKINTSKEKQNESLNNILKFHQSLLTEEQLDSTL